MFFLVTVCWALRASPHLPPLLDEGRMDWYLLVNFKARLEKLVNVKTTCFWLILKYIDLCYANLCAWSSPRTLGIWDTANQDFNFLPHTKQFCFYGCFGWAKGEIICQILKCYFNIHSAELSILLSNLSLSYFFYLLIFDLLHVFGLLFFLPNSAHLLICSSLPWSPYTICAAYNKTVNPFSVFVWDVQLCLVL